jgi:hypothetical protein
MKTLTLRVVAVVLFVSGANPATAQTTAGVPPAIWAQVEALGPVIDPAAIGKIYAPLRAQMPAAGVKKTSDLAYGSSDLQKLDLYEPATLFGHSAGATHVAAYALEKRFQAASGSGLAGVILGSGLYDPSIDPISIDNPLMKSDNPLNEGYFGADTATYAARATGRHADAPRIPLLIFEVELDPIPMLVANGTLYSVLCHRDLQCPVMYRFLMHDHISAPAAINTGDESVSLPLLNFIRAR